MASDYITYSAAARLIGAKPHEVRRLAHQGKLATRQLPGGRPRVSAQAVESMARLAVRPAADQVPVRLREPAGA